MVLSNSDDLRREEYPMPSYKTADVLRTVQQALSLGDVYRLVIESGRPLILFRKKTEHDLEEDEVTLDGVLRNADMIEYTNSSKSPFEAVVDMLHIADLEGNFPVCWATGQDQEGIYTKWFGFSARGLPVGDGTMLAGIPVKRLKTLPESALILCAAPHADAEVSNVTLGIKTVMEVFDAQDKAGSEADHPVRDSSSGRSAPVGEVGPAAGGGDGGSWFPSGFPGMRVFDSAGIRDEVGTRNRR